MLGAKGWQPRVVERIVGWITVFHSSEVPLHDRLTVTMIQCHLRVIIQPLCCLWRQIMSTRNAALPAGSLLEPILEVQRAPRPFHVALGAGAVWKMLWFLLYLFICPKPGCRVDPIKAELRAPSAPPGLGPCDLSPQNTYLKRAAVGPNQIAGVKLPIGLCGYDIIQDFTVLGLSHKTVIKKMNTIHCVYIYPYFIWSILIHSNVSLYVKKKSILFVDLMPLWLFEWTLDWVVGSKLCFNGAF